MDKNSDPSILKRFPFIHWTPSVTLLIYSGCYLKSRIPVKMSVTCI